MEQPTTYMWMIEVAGIRHLVYAEMAGEATGMEKDKFKIVGMCEVFIPAEPTTIH